jgi:hypothetical protein
MHDHGLATHAVKHLGQGRFHTRAFTRGKYDNMETLVH